MNKLDVLLGLQWGDEGKGKIVDVLAEEYDIVARFQGGPNAGHTLEFNGEKFVLHTVPSGIFREDTINVIGNGVVIDPIILGEELNKISSVAINIAGRLLISKKAHLIIPTHRLLDAHSEAKKGTSKIGSTLKGIGPTYMDKIGRNGLRIGDILSEDFKEKYEALKNKHIELLGDKYYIGLEFSRNENLWFEAIENLKQFKFIDSEQYINDELENGKSILAEGAQGTMLDIDFGTYPFVTSSNTTTSGVCTGLGVAPNRIGEVVGIVKAYTTRVGSGPFPTELHDEDGIRMRDIGREYGSTTGRERRCGWIDLVQLRYAIMINGVSILTLMKSDVLDTFDTIKVCTHYIVNGVEVDIFPYEVNDDVTPVYTELKGWNVDTSGIKDSEDFPVELKEYISYLEEYLGVDIGAVSVGPDREQTIII